MSLKRALLAVVGATAVVIGLAGCSLLPLPGGPSAQSAPTVGECWNASTAQASAWSDWKGDSAANCSATHTLYTYGVGEVKGVSSDSWGTSSSPTTLSATVATKASDSCTASYKKLLPSLNWKQQLISTYFFVPSQTQWKAGARWVRCDVGVFSFGTTLAQETFAPLPSNIAELTSTVKSDPTRYEICLDSNSPVTHAGPLVDPTAVIADCRQSPVWTLSSHGNFTEPKGAAYPSAAAANAKITEVCSKDVTGPDEVWAAYAPSASEWAADERTIECWVGQASSGPGQDV
jgi:Septum formation